MGLQFGVYVLLLTRPSTRVQWHPVSGSVCGCGHEDRVALTSSCLVPGEEEVLRGPGFCCCSASSLVSGLVVRPAQPVPIQCWRYSLFIFVVLFTDLILPYYALFVYFLYDFIVSLPYGFPLGVVHTGHMT